MNFLWLIFAHYIGDWGLQNPWVATNKGKYWMVMLGHCMVWTACMAVCLEWLGILSLWKLGFLVSTHFIADEMKCHLTPEGKWWTIYPDQIYHIIQCLIVAIY